MTKAPAPAPAPAPSPSPAPVDPRSLPRTLADLRASGWRSRTVKEEVRENFLRALADGRELFPGILAHRDIPSVCASTIPSSVRLQLLSPVSSLFPFVSSHQRHTLGPLLFSLSTHHALVDA